MEKIEQATKDQLIASNPKHSAWVAASAGSGKTKVLVDRIIRLLLNGVAPSQILCITYTNAGASEMKSRINKELMDWAIMDESELVKRLEKLLDCQHQSNSTIRSARTLFARILDDSEGLRMMTIHSFCQSILKKFPIESGIFPNFKIAEVEEGKKLLKEAKSLVLSRVDLSQDVLSSIHKLSIKLNHKDFEDLIKKFIDNVSHFLYLRDYKYGSLDSLIDYIYATCEAKKYNSRESLIKDFCSDKYYNSSELLDFAELSEADRKVEQAQIIRNWLQNKSSRKSNLQEYLDVFITQKEKTPRKTIITKPKLAKSQKVEKFINEEKIRCFEFATKLSSLEIAELTTSTLTVGNEILQIYDKLKKSKGILDYGDLIFKANELLNNTTMKDWVLYKLDSKIDHILIDEAQDTSSYQWAMVDALKNEFFAGSGQKTDKNRTIFVVGDEKQSIFSFQGAEPEIFKTKHKEYREEIKQAGQQFYTVPLQHSFRSATSILDFVDFVFKDGERQKYISFDTAKQIKHIPIRDDVKGKIEIWPLITSEANDKQEQNYWDLTKRNEDAKSKKEQALGKLIATKIKEWVDKKRAIQTKSGYRPIQYCDIMILLRKRESGKSIVKELKKLGIPNSDLDKVKIKENLAIKDIVALAKFILLPQDNLNLASILKSPLLGLTEDDVFEICAKRGEKSVWDSLQTSTKYQATAIYLKNLIVKSKIFSPYELFSYILNNKEAKTKISRRFGNHIQDLMNEFLSLILKYENGGALNLQEIIDLIDESEVEFTKNTSEQRDEVRILTIHRSKGLQSPIIILPDTNAQQANNNDKLQHDENIILWKDSSSNNPNIQKINEKCKYDEYAEYMRLLYVALTRTENELYICGISSGKWVNQNLWYSILQTSADKMYNKPENSLVRKIEYDFSEFTESECKGDGFIIGEKDTYETNTELSGHENGTQNFDYYKKLIETPVSAEEAQKIIYPSEFYKHKEFDKNINIISRNIVKGQAVHKLLEILPNLEHEKAEKLADYYLQNYSNELNLEERKFLKGKVLEVLNNEKFSDFFGKNSKSEVPIIGKIDGQIISGQIDRLVIRENEVIIIDYKTSNFIPKSIDEAPSAYKIQMDLYKNLIQKLYPRKKVKTFLLWTLDCSIIEV